MTNQKNLSDPITLRLPGDVLAEIEEIAALTGRTRSFIMVRALKAYLASEGREIRELAEARRAADAGDLHDLEAVVEEVEAILKGAAA